ncbi:hypothetical protein BGW80DRAFT_745992 [Lactifluus volemus]|nr:hypothetical protein BGW80DRAFT_745992 [Lactifluus volemus]
MPSSRHTPSRRHSDTSHGHLVGALTRRGRMRPKSNLKDTALAPYGRAGQSFARSFSPFISVSSVIHYGIQSRGLTDANSEDVPANEPELRKGYDHLLKVLTRFDEQIEWFDEDAESLSELILIIHQQAQVTRTSDTGDLKYSALEYIFRNASRESLNPPILRITSKASRGLNHPQIGRMLCPRHLLDDFDEDPTEMLSKLQDGRIIFQPGDWSTCLYDEGQFDPENPDKGLMRGHYILRVVKHIFTGPSSALSTPGSGRNTRANNAKIHNLTALTGREIAYGATQV